MTEHSGEFEPVDKPSVYDEARRDGLSHAEAQEEAWPTTSPLDAVRATLIERTQFVPDLSKQTGWRQTPCYCAQDRKPCTLHEGIEIGVDKVLALLVQVGWCNEGGVHDLIDGLPVDPDVCAEQGCEPAYRIASREREQ